MLPPSGQSSPFFCLNLGGRGLARRRAKGGRWSIAGGRQVANSEIKSCFCLSVPSRLHRPDQNAKVNELQVHRLTAETIFHLHFQQHSPHPLIQVLGRVTHGREFYRHRGSPSESLPAEGRWGHGSLERKRIKPLNEFHELINRLI